MAEDIDNPSSPALATSNTDPDTSVATPTLPATSPIADIAQTSSLSEETVPMDVDIADTTTTAEDEERLRKRKSTESPTPMAQKRPKTEDSGDDPEAILAAAIAAAEGSPSQDPTMSASIAPPSPSLPPSAPEATMLPPPPPPPSSSSYPARENMQFTATDLPKDDDGMMRWLAHRVRDSAVLNRDGTAKSETSESGGINLSGENSDPESRAERERVRAENRERKKKWREENSDRNKDNDLRGRVSRRATKLFGAENTVKKRLWMEDEFNRRKSKREFKTQLKKNETPGSSCWNANDDFSDNPSQVMADVLTGQEGAAEGLRHWIENGDIDYETWTAACQKLWGDPNMRSYLDSLAPEIASSAGTDAGGTQGGKAGTAEAGKLTDDGLASKFDAAFDAIIGRGPLKAPPIINTAPVAESVPEMPTDNVVDNIPDDELDAAMEAAMNMDLDSVPTEGDSTADALGQLSEEALLRKLIESGEMSLEDIAALEAALADEGVQDQEVVEEDDTVQGIQDTNESQLPGEGEAEFVPEDTAAAEDVEMGLPDLHSDQTDISDLHLHLDMLSPSAREAFLATIMEQAGEGVDIEDMQLDSTAENEDADTTTSIHAEMTLDQTIAHLAAAQEEKKNEIYSLLETNPGAAAEAYLEADAGNDEGGVLEFLEGTGINLDNLTEEELQKFINAVSNDGDIDQVVAEILAAHGRRDETTTQATDQEGEVQPASEQEQVGDIATAAIPDQMDVGMEQVDDEDGMYGEGEADYDDDDELDLTPDIMRIILQHSNYSSMLGGTTTIDEGLSTVPPTEDAHTVKPTPSAPSSVLPLPITRTHQESAPTPARTSYTSLQQQQHAQRQQQYGYGPAKYSYSHYTIYGYQRRPDVQVLPPGYSGYQRPPVVADQQPPRYPDLTSLIKPLAYKPKQTVTSGSTTPASSAEGSKESEVSSAKEATPDSEKEKNKDKLACWTDVFNFKIPIPTFLGRAGVGRRTSEQERLEEERNVRAMGFPPMVSELKL
ncbi:hypothetical protein TWF694_010177 [Orbilia ellipsospora]|uniref:DUF3020 domain-containing protein n=1 Tax=Orbilia ellipsospora TaxID=2528407 RepID=A0AAV9X931_9PEZI